MKKCFVAYGGGQEWTVLVQLNFSFKKQTEMDGDRTGHCNLFQWKLFSTLTDE